MDLRLKGKRALVTGSSSGIGAGIARMLAEEGCQVVVHGRNAERAANVAAEIGAVGCLVGDLATTEGCDAVAARALELAGGVDILVNNAGGGEGTSDLPWLDVPEEAWVKTFEINTMSAVRLSRRLIPQMKARGWGRIIQISSAVAAQPTTRGPDYAGSKAALANTTVALAHALSGTGITANVVSPGVILTPSVETFAAEIAASMGWGDVKKEDLEKRLAVEMLKLPVARIGDVEDVGLVVCMLASPRSGFITAANIRVDGGQLDHVN
jgi:NAD(P)-dependent dehydrogenase (short-subunit alcohol dehydrogenase family)